MPSWWQNLKSKLASYYREYEFVTAIYVLEPWEKRWANGVVALVLAIAIFSTVHYLPHYTVKLLEYFTTNFITTSDH